MFKVGNSHWYSTLRQILGKNLEITVLFGVIEARLNLIKGKKLNLTLCSCLSFLSSSDGFPRPQVSGNPRTVVALRSTNVTLNCSAFSTSDSSTNATWRKDQEVLSDAQVQNYARYQDQQLIYTSMLHLLNVNFTDEGRYQCVISNNFSANYSTEAKVTVNGTFTHEASQTT